ncbi:zona pellucida sperm-binding protein 1-like [Emydura macquarii macquarii]|uniref:zona pellucida sperm-binding protein 1-like n=1 Tax=Emydura macquarii macquarii TaxID=1129001 RepID=UPI00352A576F
MGLACRYFVGLVLLWALGAALGQGDFRRVSFSVLQHRYEYNCGDYGMQLLVFPSQGPAVRFKVVDEFGTAFEVTNCSICLHWITSGEEGVVIFSAGYNGCHVLKKDGRNHLRVRVEELLSGGAVAATYDVNMTCPKPAEHDLTPEETMRYVPQPQPGLARPVPQPQPGLARPVPQPQPGLARPVPQPQPGLARPVPQPQPGLARPVPQPQPGLARPVPQPQPGLARPVPQPQPGLARPVPQPQPGLARPVPQPQPGLARPVPQPQPGLARPVPQPQPGLARPVPQPQPGLARPVPQPQPGLARPVPQPQPGLARPVPQPQPGLARPVPQPQPGLARPVPQPQPGLARPVPQPQPGLARPVPQPQPGLARPVPQPQPGLAPGNIGAHLPQVQCQVTGRKLPCAENLGQAACYRSGCCYDETDRATPCYFGNTVTLQCFMEGNIALVVSKDMPDHPLILDSVQLAYAQAGCEPVRMSEAFVIFRISLSHCGTTVQVIGDKLIYENQLISGIDIRAGPDGSITRDSTFILHIRCIYNASDFLPVQVEVFLPPTPAPVIQEGPLRLELRIATDLSYRTYLTERDYPVVKVLRDPVYMEVRILQRTDPSLVLVLHQCWATPSANPLEQPQWPLLMDGCPFLGDNYRTQLVPVSPASSELPFPTHHQRFVLSTFAFVDSASQMVLEGLVYVFCSASACRPSQLEDCRTTCPPGAATGSRRFRSIQNGTEPLDLVSSHGSVKFLQQPAGQDSGHQDPDFREDQNSMLLHSVFLGLVSLITVTSVIVTMTLIWKRWNQLRRL